MSKLPISTQVNKLVQLSELQISQYRQMLPKAHENNDVVMAAKLNRLIDVAQEHIRSIKRSEANRRHGG